MRDLISRQAAIDKFEPWLKVRGYSEGELNMLKAVLYELRFLPSVQPEILACGEGELNVPDTNVGDMIHRQAAIDCEYQVKIINDIEYVMLSEVQMKMRKLPSAQPEIIRCRDCRHWYTGDGYNHEKGAQCELTHMWMSPDDYCSYGRRKVSE